MPSTPSAVLRLHFMAAGSPLTVTPLSAIALEPPTFCMKRIPPDEVFDIVIAEPSELALPLNERTNPPRSALSAKSPFQTARGLVWASGTSPDALDEVCRSTLARYIGEGETARGQCLLSMRPGMSASYTFIQRNPKRGLGETLSPFHAGNLLCDLRYPLRLSADVGDCIIFCARHARGDFLQRFFRCAHGAVAF